MLARLVCFLTNIMLSIRIPPIQGTICTYAGLLVISCLCSFGGVAPLREDYQVIQRDGNDKGAFTIKVAPGSYRVTVSNQKRRVLTRQLTADGESGLLVDNVPVGGPYTITVQPGGTVFHNVLVGDIWILAGQSNMYGFNLPEEELPALPYINMLNIMHTHKGAHWAAGLPPIHRIPPEFAPNELRLRPELTEADIKEWIAQDKPVGGIDSSYFFARKLYAESGVPIGLLPLASGAGLSGWDPDKRDHTRYGFLYHHVMYAGGRVKGMLWFQGEQEAIYGDEHETVTKPSLIYPLSTYSQEFRKFVAALRKDFENPDMPVILAQICRHHYGPRERYRYWEMMRETQRLIPEHLTNAHVVPTVDLDLFDAIHLDYQSQKRLGPRMEYVALPYVKTGIAPRTEIKLKSVTFSDTPVVRPRGGGHPIIVEFEGVSGKLRAPGRPTGFVLRKKDSIEDTDWVYKVEFDPKNPSIVKLSWRSGPVADESQKMVLYYAPGAAPYVNIVDENDMAVPGFGPIDVQGPRK